MTDDELLLAAALEEPRDDTPRLALADWFDEHDEPDLAAGLRAVPQTVAFLAELVPWHVVPSFALVTLAFWGGPAARPANRLGSCHKDHQRSRSLENQVVSRRVNTATWLGPPRSGSWSPSGSMRAAGCRNPHVTPGILGRGRSE